MQKTRTRLLLPLFAAVFAAFTNALLLRSRRMSTTVLMVAEKPSLAESLAKILSNGKYKKRNGISSSCPVHEFRGSFLRDNSALFKFTSVCGHVTAVDFPNNFNNWDKVNPNDLFDAPIIKKEATPKLHLVCSVLWSLSITDFLRR